VIKQATGDLAAHEARVLGRLQGSHFPRVISCDQREGSSILTMERIAGTALSESLSEVAASPRRLAAFMRECLSILEEMRAVAIEYRDIRMENLLVRDGWPVLIDFGWSESHGEPYAAPSKVGGLERIPSGPPCDLYSMGRVFEQLVPKGSALFAPLLERMLTPDTIRTLSPEFLAAVLAGLNLPGKWDVSLVWPVPRYPQLALEDQPLVLSATRPPFLKRTWRRLEAIHSKTPVAAQVPWCVITQCNDVFCYHALRIRAHLTVLSTDSETVSCNGPGRFLVNCLV
jgi:serine/threonine protein kinase